MFSTRICSPQHSLLWSFRCIGLVASLAGLPETTNTTPYRETQRVQTKDTSNSTTPDVEIQKQLQSRIVAATVAMTTKAIPHCLQFSQRYHEHHRPHHDFGFGHHHHHHHHHHHQEQQMHHRHCVHHRMNQAMLGQGMRMYSPKSSKLLAAYMHRRETWCLAALDKTLK